MPRYTGNAECSLFQVSLFPIIIRPLCLASHTETPACSSMHLWGISQSPALTSYLPMGCLDSNGIFFSQGQPIWHQPSDLINVWKSLPKIKRFDQMLMFHLRLCWPNPHTPHQWITTCPYSPPEPLEKAFHFLKVWRKKNKNFKSVTAGSISASRASQSLHSLSFLGKHLSLRSSL